MRFRLTLSVNKSAFGNLLPINYQYEQSAVIYKILARASEDYALWLHENGFQLEGVGKKFKLFTFSRFSIENYKIFKNSERLAILSNTIEWIISFLPEKSTEKFIQGVFANQVFEIGDKNSTIRFNVQNIEIISPPTYCETMSFSTISPICIRHRKSDGSIEYLSPDSPLFVQGVLEGALSRYKILKGYDCAVAPEFKFELISQPKSVLVKIKAGTPQQTKVRGYMFKFSMHAPIELMKIMYESGMGEECSQGFGCVEVTM